MTHLTNERHVERSLAQPDMWAALRICLKRVWDTPSLVLAAHRFEGEYQRSDCGLCLGALASETNTRARSTYCGTDISVGSLEVDRSRLGGTEKVQPAACDVDALSDRSWSLTRFSKSCCISSSPHSFERRSPH
jgi:hypothetical protein